jgi:hypothetical protein
MKISAVNQKINSVILFPSKNQAGRTEGNGKNEEFYILNDEV